MGARRFLPVLLAVWLLALLPGGEPIGAVRALARYALAAYVPGLVVWRALRPQRSGVVDLVLLPSLLSVLPFCWLVAAGMALGLDASRAAWAVILLASALAGLLLGRNDTLALGRNQAGVVGVACALSALLLAVPFAFNDFAASAWDGPLHAAIATRVLAGVVPPDSAIVAGQPAGYYWLYHLYTAALSELTGLSLYQAFAVVSVHSLVLLLLAGHRLAARIGGSPAAGLAGAGLLVFCLNPFGWLLFLRNAPAQPDPWLSLLVPLEMVSGYPGQLGSLIHQFLDGNPFAVSFAFWVLWLERACARLDGERGAASFVTGVLALAGALYLHLFSGALLLLASAAAALAVGRALLPMMGCAALLSLPYAADVLGEKARNPVRIDWSPGFVGGQALALAASLGVLALLAAPALRAAWRHPAPGRRFLSVYSLLLAAAALLLHAPANTQYKLIYLILPALAALAASAWAARSAPVVLAIAVAIPTSALTSYAFAANPPRETLPSEKRRLYEWVRQATPPDSVFAEHPDRDIAALSEAERLYADREWFEIPIYGRRRTLAGYTADVLSGEWGYRDIPRRQRLAKDLALGRPLRPWQRELLSALRAPVFVVARGQEPGTEAFAPGAYRLAYEHGGTRVYQVTP